ncbi:MAG: hypothetical protein ACLQK4_17020 [Acidimicrobiales bacterium]|jgi:hypothetical protein
MLSPFKRRRRGLLTSGAVAGAVLASMAFTGTAGATTTPAANNTIVGSGSSTTYYMLQQLDTLFNDSQGCQIFAPNSVDQTLNFACESTTDGPPTDNPTTYAPPEELAADAGENPYNDVAVEEPYIGSSNGVNQLKYQGSNNPSNGFLPSPINFARSSRALKSSDPAGLNFVAYARDGVDWITFQKVANSEIKAIPSSCLRHDGTANYDDIEQSYLEDIWNSGSSNISNWAELCADIDEYPAKPTEAQYKSFKAYDAPICVYTAQDGSGTLATWDGYLGITTESTIGSLTPNTSAAAWATSEGLSSTFVNSGCTNGTSSSAYGSSHQIFENETEQLVAQGASQTASGQEQYSDTVDSIFFYSFGRYTLQCKPNHAICEPTGFTVNLGEIGNQYPTKTDIIGTLCGTGCFTGNEWAVPRYLYNVYGNGDTSANIVPATPATVNYVSEAGFLCKPQTETVLENVGGVLEPEVVSIVDPITGATYISEIDAAISANGFFPLPLQSSEDSGTINYPAVDLLPAYGSAGDAYGVFDPNYDSTLSSNPNTLAADNSTANLADTNPSGYCLVFTTSG